MSFLCPVTAAFSATARTVSASSESLAFLRYSPRVSESFFERTFRASVRNNPCPLIASLVFPSLLFSLGWPSIATQKVKMVHFALCEPILLISYRAARSTSRLQSPQRVLVVQLAAPVLRARRQWRPAPNLLRRGLRSVQQPSAAPAFQHVV